jgi:hypothetical protein
VGKTPIVKTQPTPIAHEIGEAFIGNVLPMVAQSPCAISPVGIPSMAAAGEGRQTVAPISTTVRKMAR